MKLRREIDAWMATYDEKQEEKKRLARESQVGSDEDLELLELLEVSSHTFPVEFRSKLKGNMRKLQPGAI